MNIETTLIPVKDAIINSSLAFALGISLAIAYFFIAGTSFSGMRYFNSSMITNPIFWVLVELFCVVAITLSIVRIHSIVKKAQQ